jgi:hypothetical protein
MDTVSRLKRVLWRKTLVGRAPDRGPNGVITPPKTSLNGVNAVEKKLKRTNYATNCRLEAHAILQLAVICGYSGQLC